MAGIGKRMPLRDINQHLICLLCRGYLIDATTVVECLHSFCRSCILKHLSTSAQCPSCKHVLNKAKPNIKADKTLQEIVYKLVPGLYHREMLKRREFYKKHPEHANLTTPEQRGEDVSGRLIFNPEDVVSLSLEYLPPEADPLDILSTNDTDANNSNSVNNGDNINNSNHNSNGPGNSRRYLQCPALVTIAHLKKFISMKYSVDVTRYTIEICHRRATLPENWTLMDVAYIYAWKRIAPMRFFYSVAPEQRLEAPLHQRPSTPGLGARDCLPPNDVRNNSDVNSNSNEIPETSKSEVKSASGSDKTSLTKNLDKIVNNKVDTPVDRKSTETDEKDEANKTMTMSVTTSTLTATSSTATSSTATSSTATSSTAMSSIAMSSTATSSIATSLTATTISTTIATNISSTTTTTMTTTTTTMTTTTTTTTCNESNKQIKSPIKIMKNPDGKYEVLKNSSTASTVTDIKNPTSPEFSVVNSNGVKITLKQCSPPQNSNPKKPKIISDVLLRCGQIEKDTPLTGAMLQRQQQQDKDKFTTTNPVLPDKLEKQRRKVTFSMDRPPTSEKTSPTNASGTMPKTALKKPAEQQDKKQFLQGFQLTAREPSVPSDAKLIPIIRDIGHVVNSLKSFQKGNVKMEEFLKKDTDEIKKKSNTENAVSNANSNTIATNAVTKRNLGITANSRANKTNDSNGRAFNSGGVGSNSIASGNHANKMDVYTFSGDPPIVPAGAVKRKCPPGVPIADLKRRKSPQIAQKQETNKRQNVTSYNSVKLPRSSSAEHVTPTNRTTTTNVGGDYGGNSSRVSNTKASTSPLLLNDTRDFLVDGYGLNIPASLSITLTSPKSPGISGQFVEPKDPNDNLSGRGKIALGKMNPTITLNDRSVDPRVLKALKTGQIRMPSTPTKAKSAATIVATTKQTPMMDRSETTTNQQRATTFVGGKRKKEHESRDILDLSGGKKNMDLHPLRIPQPVPKLNKTNKITGRDNMQPGSISDQGQLVTLGNHLYYRAPPGSLTPAAHRVNDFPLPPSRAPVYAPCLGSINRSNSDLSSVFPTLSSFYALNQAPNLQQFHMDATRLKLQPRSIAESSASSATSETNDNPANSNISNGTPGKSHLAAQCAPVKPARSSVASLAVAINKQQQSADKSANVSNVNRTTNLGDSSNKPSTFCNNENSVSTDETLCLNVQKRSPLTIESTNNGFLSRNEDGKNASSITNEIARDTNVESRKETINPDNLTLQQQQQQNREAASPNIVSSTASPSPPPGNGNVRNEDNANHDDNNINSSNGDNNNGTSSSSTPTKNIVSHETMCNKSPNSPDSSSITVEQCNSDTTSSVKTMDRELSTDTSTKTSDANPTNVDDSIALKDEDKNKIKSEASEIAKQLTSVQKTLLAVFPSNEWANNPIAAEHLGNFLKSLNATIKSEGNAEESKTEKIDRKPEGNENR